MNILLKHNILDLGTPERFMSNKGALSASGITDAQLGEKIPRELRYACIYWADHLKSADIEDTDLMEELELFDNEHLLHWFEALSWFCRLDLSAQTLIVSQKLLVR